MEGASRQFEPEEIDRRSEKAKSKRIEANQHGCMVIFIIR